MVCKKFTAAATQQQQKQLCEMDVLLLDILTPHAACSLKRMQAYILKGVELNKVCPPIYGQVLQSYSPPASNLLSKRGWNAES